MPCQPIHNDPEGILFVGEAPGRNEDDIGLPLVGQSGALLARFLMSTGLVSRHFAREFEMNEKGFGQYCAEAHPFVSHISLTNVVQRRPFDNRIEHFFYTKTDGRKKKALQLQGRYVTDEVARGLDALQETIRITQPRIIVALGSTALWALTGREGKAASRAPGGITRWRGSMLTTDDGIPVLPTFHPAYILRVFKDRVILQHDLQARVARFWDSNANTWWTHPRTHHIDPPDYATVQRWLDILTGYAERGHTLSCDIETIYRSQISNVGFGVSDSESYTIPLRTHAGNRWSATEEANIRWRLRHILSHPRADVVGQNYEYDRTYFLSELGIKATLTRDTRTVHHTHYPSLPASLHFMASLYCRHYVYWKDESGEAAENRDDRQGWEYNGKDCCATWEIDAALQKQTKDLDLGPQVDFEMRVHDLAFRTMHRGVRVNRRLLDEYNNWNVDHQFQLSGYLEATVGFNVGSDSKSPWYNSPLQTSTFFYKWMGIKPVLNRERRPTCDDDALPKIYEREPLARPFIRRLASLRRLQTMQRNVLMRRMRNGRFNTQYTVPGTKTFRLSSSRDGQEYGLNLQNISSGDSSLTRHEMLLMPNMRKLFIPDPGYYIGDGDFARADLWAVVWDADDEPLKKTLRANLDVHTENARDIFGVVTKNERDKAKAGVHATNYYCQPPKLAQVLECSIEEAKNFQRRWFTAHPAIQRWHIRVRNELITNARVTNAFGFHCHFYGRPEQELPEALAWIPQSTVAIAINKAWEQIIATPDLAPVEVLLQVHDSLTFQWPKRLDAFIRPRIRDAMMVTVPYPDSFQIPVDLKMSDLSWGDCAEASWETTT